MIVTCPSCNAKYRVRDDAVPAGGAQLQCPECDTLFLAQPPSPAELQAVIERLGKARTELEDQVEALEGQNQALGAQLDEVRAEVARLSDETAGLRQGQEEARRLTADLEAKKVEAATLSAEVLQLRQDAMGLRQENKELRASAAAAGRLEEEVARLRTAAQAGPVPGRVEELEREVQTLGDQLARAVGAAASDVDLSSSNLASLIASVGPMLWGLDQAIQYLSQFAANEPDLAGHVRQLQLLAAVLKRLDAESP